MASGLTAEYCGSVGPSTDFLYDHRLTRIDPQIDFDWRKKKSIVSGVPVASYHARWSGTVRFPARDLYTLEVPPGAEIRLVRANGSAPAHERTDPPGHYAYLSPFAAGERAKIVVVADAVPRMSLTWRTRDSRVVLPETVPPTALTPAVAEFPTTDDGQPYASGPGKMTHFVSLPDGANGMVAFTGEEKRMDLRYPLFSRVVTERSHEGYSWVWWTERGLKNGQTRWYAYKAAYPNPITGDYTLSALSDPMSDEVDPKGIPWDTKDPARIRAAWIADTPELDPNAELGILSPDGYHYDTYPPKNSP